MYDDVGSCGIKLFTWFIMCCNDSLPISFPWQNNNEHVHLIIIVVA